MRAISSKTGANTYSGGTTISGGILKAGHFSALGSGTATLAGCRLNDPLKIKFKGRLLDSA
jgi:hypothetical protein